MPYPFPSFGGFNFQRSEYPIFGTDQGWNISPSYQRSRPLGSAIDVIVTSSIGSADRSFECYLTPERYQQLFNMVNTRAVFTDWDRPTPDSRNAFLSEISRVDEAYSNMKAGPTVRKFRTRVALVSA